MLLIKNFLIVFLILVAVCVQAQPTGSPAQTASAIEALRADNAARQQMLANLQQTLANTADADAAAITQDDLSEVRVALDQIRQSIDTVSGQIAAVQNQLAAMQAQCDTLNAQLQKLANPLSSGAADADAGSSRSSVEAQFADCQQQVLALGTLLTLQKSSLQLLQKQQSLRESQYQQYNERYLQNTPAAAPADNAYAPTLQSLQREREQLAADLHQAGDSRAARLDKNIELALVGKQILITTLAQDFQSIDRRLQELQFADFGSVSLERTAAVQTELADFRIRLQTMQSQLQSNMDFLTQQYSLYQRQQNAVPAAISARHDALIASYRDFQTSLANASETLNLIQQTVGAQYNAQSKSYLTERYNFNGGWKHLPALGEQTAAALSAFIGQYAVSFKTLSQSSAQLSAGRTFWLSAAALFITAATAFITSRANRFVRRNSKTSRMAFSSRLILFVFGMIKYNLPYIGLLALTYTVLVITRLPSPGFNFILLIPIFILLVSIPHFSIKILNQSKLLAYNEHQKLGRPITIAAAVGGILLSCVFMSGWILSDSAVINAFSWIYSVYILIIAYPLWRLILRMRRHLDSHYADYYTYRILRIVMRLIPIGFLFFGAAGTLGYLNLAWLAARYLLIALIYSLIWIGFLGLCKDLSLAAKRLAVIRTSNGVFWAQDVINPLHTIARYSSFFLLLYLLLRTYGWNAETPVISEILSFFKRPIFGGAAGQFTIMNLILMAVLIYAVFRLGIWMKSLCYRWVYAKISDLGVRNSLAVFSQYAIVTLGFLFALRIIGIDLTAFTVFAGALGVGIGFGLQTIANNFISGILLLIERPLRNGDVISVGGYDGTVERIGMRSLTMTTFDNESVILPNSDFVTSAFKNWSHADQIVRVILYIDLNYQHDPQIVESTLQASLISLAAEGHIINQTDFEPGVYAWNCSERGITYRIIYYVHLEQQNYLEARHRVINSLWKTCFENGFAIAYPKTDIYLPERIDPAALAAGISERQPPASSRNRYPNL